MRHRSKRRARQSEVIRARSHPAVDGQFGAVAVRRFVAREEQRRARDFVRQADALQRHVREEKFQRNVAQMMDSCVRFIDFDKIDVVPTSQYVVNVVRG